LVIEHKQQQKSTASTKFVNPPASRKQVSNVFNQNLFSPGQFKKPPPRHFLCLDLQVIAIRTPFYVVRQTLSQLNTNADPLFCLLVVGLTFVVNDGLGSHSHLRKQTLLPGVRHSANHYKQKLLEKLKIIIS